MWILPKQLHTSAFVPDTAALISDLDEQSQICEQSLLARSKPSLARTWSQKWKRDSWTQHLSGRILKPSHGQSFATAWTSSLEVIPASHSQQQGSDSDETTLDTSGLGLQMELFPCDQESASLRTSKDTSALDLERSLANWKDLVTLRRGEYSLRVKSAHLTNGKESSSWPTASSRDWKDSPGMSQTGVNPDGTTRKRMDQLPRAVFGADQNAQSKHGQAAPVSHSTDGSRQESWGTPSCMDTLPARSAEALARAKMKGGCKNLREEVHQWATPQTRDHRSGDSERFQNPDRSKNLNDQMLAQNAKLNPRWVEPLMGLPIGWVMPSCMSPLTIAPTNCDYSETELFPQLLPGLF
jgi:hypothetical protein